MHYVPIVFLSLLIAMVYHFPLIMFVLYYHSLISRRYYKEKWLLPSTSAFLDSNRSNSTNV